MKGNITKMQYTFDFVRKPTAVTPKKASSPIGYTGLYGFHKYWGKKPHEPLAFAIEQLTGEGDTVLDPFVGSGTAARESLLRDRRFIGFDINPVAVELTKLLVSPPDYSSMRDAFRFIERTVKDKINDAYRLNDGRTASHYLWEQDTLRQVWLRGVRGVVREELAPTTQDFDLIEKFASYRSNRIRAPRFFSNGRINVHPNLSFCDIMTGRAQRNLDLLLSCLNELPPNVQMPMKLCLTAASGQMTNMVFAVSGRGKTTGKKSVKIEVGSWVIGYWRPKLHFEVNVWNCFERRVSKLLKAIKAVDPLQDSIVCTSLERFYETDSRCCVECAPCQTAVGNVRENSVRLILTDPPHSDRVPYLELSELWNSILGFELQFDQEIVISNAKERDKTPDIYSHAMNDFFAKLPRVMRDDAFLVLLYNARQAERWTFVSKIIDEPDGLKYFGKFPCNYSAGSVVQDNRKGGLKTDIAMVFGKPNADFRRLRELENIPNWSKDAPTK